MKLSNIAFPVLFVLFCNMGHTQQVILADTASGELKVFEKVEIEAAFPGGDKAWRSFLEKNLNGSVPADNGAPIGRYTVLVQFIVGLDGKVSNIKPLTKQGYGTEQEVMRILSKSGTWTPAIMNGKPVKAYRKQPVTFEMMDDGIGINSDNGGYTLYTGMDNVVTVNVEKVKSADIKLTISEGSITATGDEKYMARVNKPGRVIIKIFNTKKNKEIGTASFEVVEKK